MIIFTSVYRKEISVATSTKEKNHTERHWVVVDNDCTSPTFQEVIGSYPTEKRARRYARVFTVVRPETEDEFFDRT